MLRVQVCGNQHFKAISPHFLSQLHADTVGSFGIHFTLGKGLIGMVAEPTARIVLCRLCTHKALGGIFFGTVDAGYIGSMFRL